MSNDTTPNGQPDVIADYAGELKEIEMQSYQERVRKARNALYWTAALLFAAEMLSMARAGEGFSMLSLVFGLVWAGIFIGLALWTRKKPYTAVMTGLIVFIGIILLVVVVNGIAYGSEGVVKALVGGIIVKVIILVTLIKALNDAKALQKAKEETF